MSHVHIRTLESGAVSLQVNGVEMALCTKAGSLSVAFPDDLGADPVEVGFTVLADSVDFDLASVDLARVEVDCG